MGAFPIRASNLITIDYRLSTIDYRLSTIDYS